MKPQTLIKCTFDRKRQIAQYYNQYDHIELDLSQTHSNESKTTQVGRTRPEPNRGNPTHIDWYRGKLYPQD